jgi:eukaryotic-like serine/threonine-protein kinase
MATDDPAPRASQPRRIGRYEIKARIGRGAMGVVYHAWDELMCRDVALKVLTTDLEDDPEIRTRFLREGQAAAALFHPNIITIFDVGEDGARFFIVMELLRGTVLKEFLKQLDAGGLAHRLHLMMQLCAGLGAAHRASICHRDIKPGNIFVRSDGLLKILDFGVARFASSGITTSGFVVGTPDYMSPEQARGEEIDNRSDIFSMGGVFYFMLTGRKPFASTVLPTLFQQIQSEDPAPLEADTPPDLAGVVMKALSKDREKRYQTCDAVLAELQAVSRRHAISPAPAAAPHVAVAVAHVDPAIWTATTPKQLATPSTDDTVDFEPGASTEDTVPILPPTWGGRLKAGFGAIAGVASRFGGSSAPIGARQSPSRKR